MAGVYNDSERPSKVTSAREYHEYQLYLALEDIDYSKTKARSLQTNGIFERFNRTVQDEFYAIAFRKKIYYTLEDMQQDLDVWLYDYNHNRTHR
ncbi:integrase core domain-containing protein [Chitinophaga alhagiae]|uniref:integrase core domain-containing protein n=1 Tax=Chitinophaga alhagiae TaxID=2203219 RepID=UPI000E5BDABF